MGLSSLEMEVGTPRWLDGKTVESQGRRLSALVCAADFKKLLLSYVLV